jgi:nitrite reductase (NO-forming)
MIDSSMREHSVPRVVETFGHGTRRHREESEKTAVIVSIFIEDFDMKAVVVSIMVAVMAGVGANAQDKAKGQKLYNEYCKTCHQETGKGLGSLYPPLAGSDYLKTKSKAEIIKAVTGGLKGEIVVNGKKYNGIMAPLPSKYTDQDVVDILTYVYGSWGNNGTKVTLADVKKNRVKAPGAKK